ncbi:MAG: hypothetical protein KC503_35970 [Myxococcales bacterium]|nr:hypothetical protein [Myxococcales bacterium]
MKHGQPGNRRARRASSKTMPQIVVVVMLAAAALLAGCRTIPYRRDPPPPEDQRGGNRAESRARRSAANRPVPWEEDKRPFDADRTGIAEHRARYEGAREPNAPTERTCARLVESYPCPLVAHRWRVHDVPGGVELVVEASRMVAHRLRDALRCHVAYGRKDADSGCLYRFRRARIAGTFMGGVMSVRITTDKAADVSNLRARVRKTVEAGQ